MSKILDFVPQSYKDQKHISQKNVINYHSYAYILFEMSFIKCKITFGVAC